MLLESMNSYKNIIQYPLDFQLNDRRNLLSIQRFSPDKSFVKSGIILIMSSKEGCMKDFNLLNLTSTRSNQVTPKNRICKINSLKSLE